MLAFRKLATVLAVLIAAAALAPQTFAKSTQLPTPTERRVSLCTRDYADCRLDCGLKATTAEQRSCSTGCYNRYLRCRRHA
jgi:hypothetical protein